jgi:hypothetical protein
VEDQWYSEEEEGGQRMRRLPRVLLREEVAAVDRLAGGVGRQLAPDLERSAVVDVPGSNRVDPAAHPQVPGG